MTPTSPQKARPYIGGQAVLEGVMMRAPCSFAVTVRRRDGTLHVRERPMKSDREGVRGWPFIRGMVSLVESLKLGSEALRFSADAMEQDLEPPANPGVSGVSAVLRASTLSVLALGTESKAGGREGNAAFWFMLLLMVGLFIALPQGAAAGLNRILHLQLEVQSPGFQLMTGALKLVIVVSYLLAIRRVGEIRRVFQYHGAEHKTITTYEANEPLTVPNARAKTTLHARCGTTFIVMVALVSIVVFTAVGGMLPRIQTGHAVLDNLVFFLEKLPFLPVIAGFTFELQRVFARYCTVGPLRALLWPGFVVQKITTIEPDDAQIEVALASLRATLFRLEGMESSVSHEDVFLPTTRRSSTRPACVPLGRTKL